MSNAHAKFEGLNNCTKCHVLGDKVTSSKCLECHTEINEKIKSGSGYHSSVKVKGKECIVCHNEHHGRNFKLVKFEKTGFIHNITGFNLEGKHAYIKCEDCHNPNNIRITGLKRKKNTYLGLEQSCISCHEDYHQSTLNNACQTCHNTVAFKPAVLFNHNTAEFKLTGAHLNLNCNKCHPVEKRYGKVFTKFKGISFQNCTSCHTDIHLGKLGSNCKKCHSTESFKSIAAVKFDHSITKFPLTGKHISVQCASCHKNGMQVKIKFGKCSDCHLDFHNGEFSVSNISPDCSNCHNTDGFKPSSYSIEDHKKTRFVLAGSHMAIACKDCHKTGDNWKFKFADVNCITCHKNIHEDEIAEKFMGNNNCNICHNENSWHKVFFDHKSTGFILEGKHGELLCSSCHALKNNLPVKYVFKSVKSDCESCHMDVHSGQFKIDNKTDCSKCHYPETWKKLVFDHSKTGFPLTGAHQNIECGKCHNSFAAANNISYIVYKISKSKCSDCHK